MNLDSLTSNPVFKKAVVFFSHHRVIIVFIIASASVLLAVIQSGSYLNPTRNEDLYNEEVVRINYPSIDQETLTKLQQTQNDQDITVDPSLAPNRSNPFSE